MVKCQCLGLKSFVMGLKLKKIVFTIFSSRDTTKFLDHALSLMRSPSIIVYFFVTFDKLKLENKMVKLVLIYNCVRIYDSYELHRFQLSIFILSPRGNILNDTQQCSQG